MCHRPFLYTKMDVAPMTFWNSDFLLIFLILLILLILFIQQKVRKSESQKVQVRKSEKQKVRKSESYRCYIHFWCRFGRQKSQIERSCILSVFVSNCPPFDISSGRLQNLVSIDWEWGWAVGCNFWENIRDLLPLAGEHIPWNGGKDYFCRQISFWAFFSLLKGLDHSSAAISSDKLISAISFGSVGVFFLHIFSCPQTAQ